MGLLVADDFVTVEIYIKSYWYDNKYFGDPKVYKDQLMFFFPVLLLVSIMTKTKWGIKMTLQDKKEALKMFKKEVIINQIYRDQLEEIKHVLTNEYFLKNKNYDDVIPFIIHKVRQTLDKGVK